VARTVAALDKAEAVSRQSRNELERTSALGPDGVSRLDLEKTEEALHVAAAEVELAKAAKVEAERQAVASEETLRTQEERLADTRVLAPFDGLVIRRMREPGEVVVPGSDILQVVSTEGMWVSAWVDESSMSRLSIGQPARIVFRSEPDRLYSGRVARLSPQTDRETREFLVDVEVLQMPRVWAIGQRAEVYIQTDRREGVITLPQGAVVWREGNPGVFVDDGGRARWRPVVLGVRALDAVEVVEGLRPGEAAITSPDPRGLEDGRTVRVP
jgi:HlyD family secretion protein